MWIPGSVERSTDRVNAESSDTAQTPRRLLHLVRAVPPPFADSQHGEGLDAQPKFAVCEGCVLAPDRDRVALSGCDWPQFRNGPERSGFTQKAVVEFAGTPGLAAKWSAPTAAPVQSSPVVASGVAYVGSNDGHLYAYDTRTGAPALDRDGWTDRRGPPAVANGVVFVGSADTTLYAFAATDGTPKWSRSCRRPTAGQAPRRRSSVRVFVTSADRVYALNAADGSDVWSTPSGLPGPLSAPAVAGDLVYVTSYSDGTVDALHADDGSAAWRTTAPGT